ncbi:MAG: DCC1-like thiol-disulfide oxidoreductase family protein, partial [Pseudomonadota bacterium]
MSSIQPLGHPPFSYRNDPAIPRFDESYWHVVMDDRCGLCTRAARRIARADRQDRVRIVPVRSDLGEGLMRHYCLDPHDPQSWLLIREGKAFGGLDAATKLFPELSVRYVPLQVLSLLPRNWRDSLYRAVATRRYRWFGQADLCAIPDAQVQARLVT